MEKVGEQIGIRSYSNHEVLLDDGRFFSGITCWRLTLLLLH